MPDFTDWIARIKNEDPTLEPFVTRLNNFFSETGFNSSAFEKAVSKGLNAVETKIIQSFTNKEDAEGK